MRWPQLSPASSCVYDRTCFTCRTRQPALRPSPGSPPRNPAVPRHVERFCSADDVDAPCRRGGGGGRWTGGGCCLQSVNLARPACDSHRLPHRITEECAPPPLNLSRRNRREPGDIWYCPLAATYTAVVFSAHRVPSSPLFGPGSFCCCTLQREKQISKHVPHRRGESVSRMVC